jgi:hypothetical protein
MYIVSGQIIYNKIKLEFYLFVIEQTYKCFDNYLSMVSQLYFGLPLMQSNGKVKNDSGSVSFGPISRKSPALNNGSNGSTEIENITSNGG